MKQKQFENNKSYTTLAFVGFGIFAILVFILNISVGSVNIAISDIFKYITQGFDNSQVNSTILLKIRMPRSIAVLFGGAAIAVSGLLLQIFFRNPIVEPFILGISSGSSLMVGIVMLSGVLLGIEGFSMGAWTIFFAAFLGAVMVMLIILAVATKVKNIVTLLVIGLMIGYVCSALTSVMTSFADANQVKAFSLWQMGSFSGFTWQSVKVLVIITTPLLIISLFISKPLNALMLGENYAMSLGVNIKAARVFIVLISSLLCAVVTAFAGPVSFIGLAIPHLSRIILKTSNNKKLFPASMLMGAGLTGLCDFIARMVFSPAEISLGAVTALIGAPMVIYMMLRRSPSEK